MATITVGIDTSRVYNRSSHVIIGSYEAKNEDRQQTSLKSLMSTLVMCFFNIFISLKNYKYLETAIGMSTSDTELVWCGTFSIEQSTEYIFFKIMEVWNVNSEFRLHDWKRIYIELKTYFSNPSTSKVTWKILLLQMSFPTINFPFMMTQESWCIFSGKLLQVGKFLMYSVSLARLLIHPSQLHQGWIGLYISNSEAEGIIK